VADLLSRALARSLVAEFRNRRRFRFDAGSAEDQYDPRYQPVWPAPGLLVWFSTGYGFWINPLVDSVSAGVLPANDATVSLPGAALGHSAAIRLIAQTANGAAPTPSANAGSVTALPPSVQLAIANPASSTRLSQSSTTSAQAFLSLPYWRPWWNVGGVTLLAIDVRAPASPALVSTFNFNPTNAWGFSTPFTASGLIYFTHEQSDYLPRSEDWRVSECLDVVDYSDPTTPTLRPAVSVPGQLTGLASDGAMLYLLGTAVSASGAYSPNDNEGLNACAYDGVAAYLVTSLSLPQTWPRPVLVSSGAVYLGRAAAAGKTNNTLEAWSLSTQGHFTRQALAALSQPVSALAVFGKLLAAQDENNAVTLFDTTSPSALRSCGRGGPPGCLWADLNHADGALNTGLWLSLDDYGVAAVPLNSAP